MCELDLHHSKTSVGVVLKEKVSACREVGFCDRKLFAYVSFEVTADHKFQIMSSGRLKVLMSWVSDVRMCVSCQMGCVCRFPDTH